jgi:hypothetical protein
MAGTDKHWWNCWPKCLYYRIALITRRSELHFGGCGLVRIREYINLGAGCGLMCGLMQKSHSGLTPSTAEPQGQAR